MRKGCKQWRENERREVLQPLHLGRGLCLQGVGDGGGGLVLKLDLKRKHGVLVRRLMDKMYWRG